MTDDKLRPEVRFDGPEYENFIDADEDVEEEEDEPEPRLEETIEHEGFKLIIYFWIDPLKYLKVA